MGFEHERQRMMADIENGFTQTQAFTGRDQLHPRVRTAMLQVPREDFVPPNMRHAAFADGALPVGHGQTISQPYIVALMTDLLELDETSVVLEIGTGTGYQTAILSQLAQRVYSVERIPELARSAQTRLKEMGCDNVETRCNDGYLGWPEKAPFDAILVTAAAPKPPEALLEQLAYGGRMVIPVGLPHAHQELVLITRDAQGKIDTRDILGVAFVPMI
jgi:protein-L-isoaspartate(D-aspartate) O-methyltransferase